MYLLAGNAIVFSNTKAQSLFMKEYPGIGLIYEPNDAGQLASILKKYISEPLLLQQHRDASKQVGIEKLNWEKEKYILLKKVEEVFESK